MPTEHWLFLVQRVAPRSGRGFARGGGVLPPPGGLLLDVLGRWFLCCSCLVFLKWMFHVVFCILLLVIYM